jgi:hypothetical protein
VEDVRKREMSWQEIEGKDYEKKGKIRDFSSVGPYKMEKMLLEQKNLELGVYSFSCMLHSDLL